MATVTKRVAAAPGGAPVEGGHRTVEPEATVPDGHRVVVRATGAPDAAGRLPVEVVVDGWRFALVVEDETRAALRERASRDLGTHAGAGGPLEVRAIIPGRVVSVAVVPGDRVEPGQTLLAVEAMKMQNELRAPRAGTVARVPASAGSTVELGDLLVVLDWPA